MRDNAVAIESIRRRLAQSGWSPGQLARQAEVAENTVRRMLDGKAWPVASTLSKLERALAWPPGRIEELAEGNYVEDQEAATAAASILGATTPERRVFQSEYRGWLVTILPAEDATDEEVEAVAPSTIATAVAKINEARKSPPPDR